MIFIFDIIKQFNINALISLITENPFYVVENLIMEFIMFLILYFFITKKKYGFNNIFFTGFIIITRNLGEKFNNNYQLYFVNIIFFYLLFLFIVVQNLLRLISEILIILAILHFIGQVAFILVIYNRGGFQFFKTFVLYGIRVLIAFFLNAIKFMVYFLGIFCLFIRFFINLVLCFFFFKNSKSKKIFYYFLILPSNYFFPIPATKVMAAIVDFHHDLMFYLMFFTVFIFWMLLTTVLLFSKFNKQKTFICNKKISIYKIFLEFFWTSAFMIFLGLLATPSISLTYFINDLSNDSNFFARSTNNYWFWNYALAYEKPWLIQNMKYSKGDVEELCLILFLNKFNLDNYTKFESVLFVDKAPALKVNNFLELFFQDENKLLLVDSVAIQNWFVLTYDNKIDAFLKTSYSNLKIITSTNFVNKQLNICDNFYKNIWLKTMSVFCNKENLENLFFTKFFNEFNIGRLHIDFSATLVFKESSFDYNKPIERDKVNISSSWYKKFLSDVQRPNSLHIPKNFKSELDIALILTDELKTTLFNELKLLNDPVSFLEEFDINAQKTYHSISNYSELSPKIRNFMVNNPTCYETLSYKVYCLKTDKMLEFDRFIIDFKEKRMTRYLNSDMHKSWQNMLKNNDGKDFLIGIRFYPDSLEYLNYSKNEHNLDNWELMLTTIMKIPKSQVDIDSFEKSLSNRSLQKCRKLEKLGLLDFEKCAKGGYRYKDGFYEDFSGIIN